MLLCCRDQKTSSTVFYSTPFGSQIPDSNMAPSAIEPETVAAPEAVNLPKYQVHKSVYKELARYKVDLEAETGKKEGFQAAKVCPSMRRHRFETTG